MANIIYFLLHTGNFVHFKIKDDFITSPIYFKKVNLENLHHESFLFHIKIGRSMIYLFHPSILKPNYFEWSPLKNIFPYINVEVLKITVLLFSQDH